MTQSDRLRRFKASSTGGREGFASLLSTKATKDGTRLVLELELPDGTSVVCFARKAILTREQAGRGLSILYSERMRELNLSGGDITVLKTLGLSGTQMSGGTLAERAGGMEVAELIDTVQGLIMLGYVVSDRDNIRSRDELERATLRVNSSYARELKEAFNPQPKKKSRRQRRG